MKFLLKLCLGLLGFGFCATTAIAQSTISGTITNKSTGANLVGATVAVKGTKTVTTTNSAGAFTITVPANNRTLKIHM